MTGILRTWSARLVRLIPVDRSAGPQVRILPVASYSWICACLALITLHLRSGRILRYRHIFSRT